MLDGIRKMYYEDLDIFYYITLMNENYEMPILPLGSSEGIIRGIYRLSEKQLSPGRPHVRLFGSGAILREALRAQDLLEQKFGVASSVYSVTSYKNLYYDGRDCDRWNRLHPGEPPRQPYVQQVLQGTAGPIVAASDYVAAVPQAIGPWAGPDYTVLGTDGFGRSEARTELRRFFEVDAENIVLTALSRLASKGDYPEAKLCEAISALGLDPNKPNQVTK